MKTIRWFVLGFGIAFGSTAGILATAAPGDLIYEAGGNRREITAQHAAAIADVFIAAGIWDGPRTGILKACAFIDKGSSTGFSGFARGFKISSPANLPVGQGVRVVGIVE